MENTILSGAILLAIVIALFFVLREVNLWYWKINERINTLNNQVQLQTIQSEQAIKQTELLSALLAASLSSGKKMALNHKTTGQLVHIEPGQLQDYSLREYDLIIIDKTN